MLYLWFRRGLYSFPLLLGFIKESMSDRDVINGLNWIRWLRIAGIMGIGYKHFDFLRVVLQLQCKDKITSDRQRNMDICTYVVCLVFSLQSGLQ